MTFLFFKECKCTMYIDIKFFVISLQYMKDMCLLKRINPKKITISLFSFKSFDCSYYMQKCQKQADGENLWYFKLWLFARGFGPFPRMLCLLTSIWPIHHNFFFYIFCSCTVCSVQCTVYKNCSIFVSLIRYLITKC